MARRRRKCKVCREWFWSSQSNYRCCSPECSRVNHRALWREWHRENMKDPARRAAFNERHRLRHAERVASDPEYREFCKARNRAYYLKSKERKANG